MTGHRVTETDLFKRLASREVEDGFEAAQISSRLNFVLEEAWHVLQQVSRNFPLYTLHDPEHSYRVAQNMSRIIPPATLAILNSVELSILIYAAYFHDIGMASSQDEFYQWLKSAAYSQYVLSRERWSTALRLVQVKAESISEEAHLPTSLEAEIPPATDSLELRCLQDIIYTDYLRETHAARGAEYVLHRHSEKGKSSHRIQVGEVNYAREVALVCQSHWESPSSLKADKYRRDLYIGRFSVNLQYCSIVLRLADVLELDPERTPAALLDFIMLDLTHPSSNAGLIDAARMKSAEEWAKHRAIVGQKITPDEIRIEARCSHPAIQKGLREWCDYIDAERRECRMVARENTEEIAQRYRIDLSQDVRKDYIQTDGSYIFTDFQLQLDYDRIVSLLMGTQLWGNPAVVVRELLQNALDACHHRAALSRRLGIPYTPRVTFSLTREDEGDRGALLTCEDNGTGMNQELIERYLMKVGSSYYESAEFRRQALDFKPISHFGLGLMSCFMLANKIAVETQHVDERLNKEPSLRAEFESIGRYVVLRPLSKERDGTRVLIPMSRSELDPIHYRRDHRKRMPIFDGGILDTLHEVAVHLDVPVQIRYGTDYQYQIDPKPFTAPELNADELPCMAARFRSFEFDYTHAAGGGIAGKFRFLLPINDEGEICLGCTVENTFKAFIDNDGDLCLTAPSYKDEKLPTDFGLSNDWDTDEIRGVYRYKFGRKPVSDRYDNNLSSSMLEIIRGSFRWSQDGLLVGFEQDHDRPAHSKNDGEEGRADRLFDLVPVPGLNAADIDLRDQARVSLNVQRDDFLRDATFDSFQQKYYALAAEMWIRILADADALPNGGANVRLLWDLLDRANEPLRMQLESHVPKLADHARFRGRRIQGASDEWNGSRPKR
jgi:Histidine kinase-, DNA gyrase B-, and HSP90-like ATPase